MFTTSRDSQEKVHIRIYQGESDTEDENELMGELELSGLNPNARRGEAQIALTFEIDNQRHSAGKRHRQGNRTQGRRRNRPGRRSADADRLQ
jgi:molecular chaperone DnaK (HSP70)